MFLYCVYNNDLLEELRDIPCAVKIGTLKISGVGFADDISVMSTSLFTLQHLTDVCVNHSRKWRYEFGPSKIQLIIYGGQGGQLVINHSDLRDYISDITGSFRRMHAWRLTRFISR